MDGILEGVRPILEPNTILVYTLIISLMLAAVLGTLAFRRSYRLEGVGYLSLAFVSIAGSISFLFVNKLVNEPFWVLLVNLGLVLAVILIYDGLARIRGWRVDRWWYLPFMLTIAVTLTMFTEFMPSFGARRLVTDGAMAFLFSVMAFRLFRPDRPQRLRFSEQLLLMTLLFFLVNIAFRSSAILLSELQSSAQGLLNQALSVQLIFLMANSIGLIFLGLSLIFMVQDRLLIEIETNAAHDDLTGVMTRTVVLDVLGKLLSKVRRDGISVGIMVADIDHFKRVNDRYGHRVGDTVLINVAHAMRNVLRGDAFLGRIGGEEFAIIATGLSRTDFIGLAERVRNNVQTWETSVRGEKLHVTISIGGCVVTPENIDELSDPLHLADIAMYRAKANGRNRVEMHAASS